jgi:hypothetical protein
MPSAATAKYLDEIESVDDSGLMVGYRLLGLSLSRHNAARRSAKKAPAKKKAAAKKKKRG